MKDSLTISIFVSVIYLIVKFINMNFIEKETRSVKVIMKDTLFVFISVNLGLFLMSQVDQLNMKLFLRDYIHLLRTLD